MDIGETRAPRLVQDADQIDHRVRPADGIGERRGVPHIHFGNLHARQEKQRLGVLARPGGHDDFTRLAHQSADDVAAHKPGSAQDNDLVVLHFSVSA